MKYLIGALLIAIPAVAGVAIAGDDSQRGWLRNPVEDYISSGGAVQGDLTLENGEKISNSTDGNVCLVGGGGTSDEDVCFDLDGSDVIDISSTTGVATWDWGTINLATDGLDLSDGDITNAGDIALDSLTADATSGGITMGGTGAVGTESLLWKYGETDNRVNVSSATGVDIIDWGPIDLYADDISLSGNIMLESGGTIATNGDGDLTLAPGGTGQVVVPRGTVALPGLVWPGYPTTGIYMKSANELGVGVSGAVKFAVHSNWLFGYAPLDMRGNKVFSGTSDVQFGAPCDAAGATTHTCVGGPQLLVDNKFATGNEGVTIANGATTFAVTSSFATITGDAGGDEVIATITGGIEGMRLTLLCVDSLWTLTDTDAHTANTVDLDAPFVGADDEILVLIHDGTSWYEQGRSKNSETSLTLHGEMFVTAGGGLTVSTQSIPYTVDTLATGDVNGWTFTANTTGAITAYSDGTGKVNVADASHGLVTGDVINIQDTTNYNGIWAITYIDDHNFSIPDTWVANDGASNWFQGDRLVANTGSAGKYEVHFYATAVKGAGASQEFTIQGYINETASTHMIVDQELATTNAQSMPFGGIITIADGDEIFLTITNNEGTNDITLEHATFWLSEI